MAQGALEHFKQVVIVCDEMYESMAARLGNQVRCKTCGRDQTVEAAKCLRTGWPKCCGYTMELLPAQHTASELEPAEPEKG